MRSGTIDVGAIPGGLDLSVTLESGQTYLWWREDDHGYDDGGPGEGWYATTTRGHDGRPVPIRARQRGDTLEWASTVDADPVLRRRLGLGADLPAIRRASADHALLESAYDAHWGLRIVRDPPFPTLVTFICSAQMRVARIHGMQQALREALGTSVTVAGTTYHAYPTPEQVAAASETDLRDLGLGYRAPYVRETAELVATGAADPAAAADLAYEDAREALTEFVGVGPKVADCVLLFSLGFLEAVPLDTWIRGAIAEHFPACDRGSYTETSRAIRERLGGEYAGYAQTYLFHHLRTGAVEAAAD